MIYHLESLGQHWTDIWRKLSFKKTKKTSKPGKAAEEVVLEPAIEREIEVRMPRLTDWPPVPIAVVFLLIIYIIYISQLYSLHSFTLAPVLA